MAGGSVSAGAAVRRESEVRLADLVAALSLGIDLGFGQPMEHVLRQCMIALRMAELVDLDDQMRSDVYYTALLVNVGCHSDAHEQAKWFGDDIECKSRKYETQPRSLAATRDMLRLVGKGHPLLQRFRIGLDMVLSAHELTHMIEHHAKLASVLAQELGLPPDVQRSVGTSYEQWDGKGWPGELSGTDIPVAARLAQLAEYVEVAHRLQGVPGVVALARERRGKQFDPTLTDLLLRDPEALLGGLDGSETWDAVIDAEPKLRVTMTPDHAAKAMLGVANFVDLKSPYTLGHSRAVSELAAAAGMQLRLSEIDIDTLQRTGLVLGFGRLGISNAIWDKPGPLGAGERERVRMQPYLTERMLKQSSWLGPLSGLAGQHRERLDGSGYPRGLHGSAISMLARVLGAADAYQAMCEPRPYREPLGAVRAASELRADVRAGRLDADAVDAVLHAAGHVVERRGARPASLTAREVDVLRLLAQGLSSRQIGERLVISPKTARNHIEHIYAKIGASTRATASLYALQHGLLPQQEYPGRT